VGRPAYFHHPSSRRHDTGAHPERIARIDAIETVLEPLEWAGFERVLAPAVDPADLAAVHTDEYVAGLAAFAAAGGGALDLDTVMSPGSFEAAAHAAGGAVAMVDALLAGDIPVGFVGARPPGHHAEAARAMGFCLFNNVAIAARHALGAGGCRRVLILDWDVHHGNGTSDAFHATDEVLFVSIHQWPLYPGTGAASDLGDGPGTGYTVNLPVPAGSGDDVFCSHVDHLVRGLALACAPDLVLVSAGYDAHVQDPLAGCAVTTTGFERMARSVRRLADELGVPLGVVLEGGYDLEALAESVALTLGAIRGGARPDPGSAVHPLTGAAAQRLAPWWPSLEPLVAP
jgi:acetoin utilization deacetylase AcuC-like enzyme